MSVAIVIDVNLSPEWAPFLAEHGWSAVYWADIGDPRAPDTAIMAWAREHQHVVLTHDLDFSALLALTQATGPSVLQVRGQQVLPEHLGVMVVAALGQFAADLESGAVVVVDRVRARVHVLPL